MPTLNLDQVPARQCPTWCREPHDFRVIDVAHWAVIGQAGPVEVALEQRVIDGELAEVEIVITNPESSASEQITIPLDGETPRQLAVLLCELSDH